MAGDKELIVDTRIDTGGITKGTKDLEKHLTKAADSASDVAQEIEKSLDSIDVKDVAEGLSEAFEREGRQAQQSIEDLAKELPQSYQDAYNRIEALRADDATDQRTKSAQIAGEFRKLGQSNSDAMKQSWAIIKSEGDDGARAVIDNLQEIAKNAEESGGTISDTFKSVFGANFLSNLASDAFQKIGDFLKDSAKESVEAAADIAAANAQFEQTFKGVESTARKALNAVADETGITASRMQGSYTKIFAFTKSVGADTETALDISERAMRAAADSAAYYDVSIEEATETLQSFLKGNYENDAALGIAATETTRNAKANEMYAVSFDKLSESQKVDVLLAMVEAGNAASGALGQAAREADAWENVMGELQEAWRQLLGVFGSPIIAGLTPVIQGITEELQNLTEVAAADNLAQGMKDFQNTLTDLDDQFQENSRSIEKNALMAERYRDRLAELEAAGLETAESQREYQNAVAALNGIYPDLNLQIDEQTGLLDANSRAQLNNLDAMKQKAVMAAQEEKYSAALEAQADAILAVQDAENQLLQVQSERSAIEKMLSQTTGKSGLELIQLYHNQREATALLSAEELKLLEQYVQLTAEQGRLTSGIESGNAAIAEQDAQLQTLAEQYGLTADAQSGLTAEISESEAAAQKLVQEYTAAKDAALDSINSQIGLFDQLNLKSDMSAQQIVENWRSQQTAFQNYSANLQKAIDMGLDQSLIQQFADGSTQSMMYLDALINGSGLTVDEINAEFQRLNEIKNITSGVMAEVETGLEVVTENTGEAVNSAVASTADGTSAILSDAQVQIGQVFVTPTQEAFETLGGKIEEAFSTAASSLQESWGDKGEWFTSNVYTPISGDIEDLAGVASGTWTTINNEAGTGWEAIVKTVAAAVDKIQSEIDSITGKTVYVNVQQTGSAASYANTTSVASIPMPMLAKGAVIPPNAPFAAILGDQRKGINIEAPAEEIYKQNMRALEEFASRIGSSEIHIHFDGDLAQLGRLLKPVIDRENDRVGVSLAKTNIR